MLTGMWKAHLSESNDLRYVIKATEDKLNYQIKINREQVVQFFLTKYYIN